MFDSQMFIEMITDHVENPRHYGRMADSTVQMTYGNPGCGDLITVFLKLDDQERVVDISFVDENPNTDNPNTSCSVSRGATSILTEMVIGKTLSEIAALDPKEWVDEIGGQAVAATRPKCITLGLSAVKNAEKRYRYQQQQNAQS
ncbi:MAG: iron-sulfur cluster assembly scaffold protein [Anaerolineae bacterium]|nr:iron-sulfur cluster assembly scaffold protein [Anaerolineae bacterium]